MAKIKFEKALELEPGDKDILTALEEVENKIKEAEPKAKPVALGVC